MKVNKAAMSRLIKAFIGKEKIAIPTNSETKLAGNASHEKIHWVPIKSIVRNEEPYKDYRKITDRTPRTNPNNHNKNDVWYRPDSVENVNHIRRGIRRGDAIEPVILRHLTPETIRHFNLEGKVKSHHHFMMQNGHHRLTAHQAEGKRFIRAVIRSGGGRIPEKPISLPPEPDSELDRAWDDPNG
jgi:hypothetical protein